MSIDRKAGIGLLFMLLAAGVAALLAVGCGGDSAGPGHEVTLMGGVLMDRGTPPGTPYQVGAVVSVDGSLVEDADVRINGAPMTYMEDPAHPEMTGFVGLITASRGDVLTLSASAAGKSVSHQATVPGQVAIHAPAGGYVYADNQDIPITWDPATGAALTIVTCGSASSSTPGMWMVAPTTSAHTIPAAATAVPGSRISVMGISGTGDLPSTVDLRQWAGKHGFWVTSQDYLDVMITQ